MDEDINVVGPRFADRGLDDRVHSVDTRNLSRGYVPSKPRSSRFKYTASERTGYWHDSVSVSGSCIYRMNLPIVHCGD